MLLYNQCINDKENLIFIFCIRAESLPSARWIVNFDLDFMDGLVLAAVLAAHCPFLVSPLHHRLLRFR